MKMFTFRTEDSFVAETEEEAVKLFKEKYGTDNKVVDIKSTDLILAPYGKESLEGIKEGNFSSVTLGLAVYEYGWNFVDEEKDKFNYEINFKVVKGKLRFADAIRVYGYTTTEADFDSKQIKEIESIVQKKYDKEYPYERN